MAVSSRLSTRLMHGMDNLDRVSRKKGFVFRHCTMLVALGLLSINFILTFLFAKASTMNYPGGVALATFNERYAGQGNSRSRLAFDVEY